MTTRLPNLTVATGKDKQKTFLLPKIPCQPGSDDFPVPGVSKIQVPIRICFGLTANKAQVQSFERKSGIDLTDDCFAHEHMFVGHSRATNHRHAIAFNPKTNKEKPRV